MKKIFDLYRFLKNSQFYSELEILKTAFESTPEELEQSHPELFGHFFVEGGAVPMYGGIFQQAKKYIENNPENSIRVFELPQKDINALRSLLKEFKKEEKAFANKYSFLKEYSDLKEDDINAVKEANMTKEEFLFCYNSHKKDEAEHLFSEVISDFYRINNTYNDLRSKIDAIKDNEKFKERLRHPMSFDTVTDADNNISNLFLDVDSHIKGIRSSNLKDRLLKYYKYIYDGEEIPGEDYSLYPKEIKGLAKETSRILYNDGDLIIVKSMSEQACQYWERPAVNVNSKNVKFHTCTSRINGVEGFTNVNMYSGYAKYMIIQMIKLKNGQLGFYENPSDMVTLCFDHKGKMITGSGSVNAVDYNIREDYIKENFPKGYELFFEKILAKELERYFEDLNPDYLLSNYGDFIGAMQGEEERDKNLAVINKKIPLAKNAAFFKSAVMLFRIASAKNDDIGNAIKNTIKKSLMDRMMEISFSEMNEDYGSGTNTRQTIDYFKSIFPELKSSIDLIIYDKIVKSTPSDFVIGYLSMPREKSKFIMKKLTELLDQKISYKVFERLEKIALELKLSDIDYGNIFDKLFEKFFEDKNQVRMLLPKKDHLRGRFHFLYRLRDVTSKDVYLKYEKEFFKEATVYSFSKHKDKMQKETFESLKDEKYKEIRDTIRRKPTRKARLIHDFSDFLPEEEVVEIFREYHEPKDLNKASTQFSDNDIFAKIIEDYTKDLTIEEITNEDFVKEKFMKNYRRFGLAGTRDTMFDYDMAIMFNKVVTKRIKNELDAEEFFNDYLINPKSSEFISIKGIHELGGYHDRNYFLYRLDDIIAQKAKELSKEKFLSFKDKMPDHTFEGLYEEMLNKEELEKIERQKKINMSEYEKLFGDDDWIDDWEDVIDLDEVQPGRGF